MLIRRNSVLWIDGQSDKKISQLGLSYRDFFQPTDQIIRDYVAEHSDTDLTVDRENANLEAMYASLAERAKIVDPTLEKHVIAMGVRQIKQLDNLAERLRRREKKKYDLAVSRIRLIRERLFPGGSLQERKDNFLNIYLEEGPGMIDTLIEHLDPITPGMVIIQ